MPGTRIERFRELDRLIAGQDPLAGRVLDNELKRHGNIGRKPRRAYGKYEPGPSVRSMQPSFRHPLDKTFRCGFDPLNVSIKQYRVHISNCQHQDCIERHHRWLDLMEYFR